MKQLFFLLMFVSVLSLIACDDTVDVGTVIESIEGRAALLGVPESVPPEPPPAVVHRTLPPDVLAAMKYNSERLAIPRQLKRVLEYTGTNPYQLQAKQGLLEKGVTDLEGFHAWQQAFYVRYIDAGGVAIVGPDTVADRYFLLAREAILVMTAKRPELRNQVLSKHRKFYMVLVNDYLEYNDIPEKLTPGFINSNDFRLPYCNGGSGPNAISRYGYCWAPVRHAPVVAAIRTVVHEFAHAIEITKWGLDPTFKEQAEQAWKRSKELGTWEGTDLNRVSYFEYWAEAVELWFFDIGTCNETSTLGKALFQTYDDLFQRDPLLFELLDEWFPRVSLVRPGDERLQPVTCRFLQ